MNNPRPYGDDPRRGDPYGRRPGPPQQGQPHGSWNEPPRGPDGPPPPPGPPRDYRGPEQPPRQASGRDDSPEDWHYEENTRVIGKLGYVPPEARAQADDFGSDRVTPEDRAKFRARKRAKKASPLAKTAGILAVVLVVGLIGGGIWWLSGDDEPTEEGGLTYAVIDAPCDPLDTAALDDLSTEVSPMAENSREVGSKTEQKCAVRVGTEPGTGADVELTSIVFSRDAGARNEFQHVQSQSAELDNYSKLSGVGEDAFVITRPWNDETGTADYSLHLWDGNAYLYTRVVVYTEISDEAIAEKTAAVAQAYLDNWKS
ncbi:hypothetical protein FB566_3944 [Stackebrandtia endophytica]|uniref:Uncharacterized protein n=1 Tax=Stackebrandtia endophytica TaxID=1496996 RepID=A0A543B0J9_9ACTN|nr:hypothetical protein [Stackebrandtia endophytica]TQL78361.1 hypothetical protein FB566_3944 [Stackebrandtia endophytica]